MPSSRVLWLSFHDVTSYSAEHDYTNTDHNCARDYLEPLQTLDLHVELSEG